METNSVSCNLGMNFPCNGCALNSSTSTRCVREGKTKALDSSRCNCGAYLTLSRDESSLAYKIQTANIGPPSHNHPLSAPVGEHVKMTLSQVGQDALQDLAILQQCDVPVAGMKRFVLLVRVLYDAGS